jgi:hypothetical protein
MTDHNRLLTSGWVLSLLAAGFVAVHLFLFHVLRQTNLAHRFLPSALLFVVLLLAAVKHVGLLAVLRRRVDTAFRRRQGMST